MLKAAYFKHLSSLMAEHTYTRCQKTCKQGGTRCCCGEYCSQYVQAVLPGYENEIEALPEPQGVKASYGSHRHSYLDPETMLCAVPPHLRVHCTLHQCEIASFGRSVDREWTERYWTLRDQMNEIALYDYETKED